MIYGIGKLFYNEVHLFFQKFCSEKPAENNFQELSAFEVDSKRGFKVIYVNAKRGIDTRVEKGFCKFPKLFHPLITESQRMQNIILQLPYR
jgi:hypothetical protein